MRPPTEIKPTVYSNLDHILEDDVVKELELSPDECFARHAAWDFNGYIWTDGKQWFEEVWVYGVLIETLTGDKPMDVIEAANRNHGSN
jgi:hypothetical protein